MPFAILLILLVVGTVLFHFLSPWWFTPIASNWEMMDDTVKLTFWVTGFVFVVVNLFDSMEAVKQFAGPDYAVPVFEPEARVLLSKVEPIARHYHVRASTV